MKQKSVAAPDSRRSKARDIAELKALLGKQEHSYRYEGARLPVDVINVLPQPRKTFENIEELKEDVARKGYLNPPTVARFNYVSCKRYIEVINLLWDAGFAVRDLRSISENGEDIFYILLAGERRLRAGKLLWDEGCEKCREKRGVETPGKCFRRHFRGGAIEVRLCRDIPPLPSIFLQLSENTHMPVPAHEEASAYSQLFQLIRQAQPKFPVAAFAREIGRSPSTVQNALRFAELPRRIKEPVEKGHVPYGVAVELTRLHRNGILEKELERWLLCAVAENLRIPDLKRRVNAYLDERAHGQQSLLEIMEAVKRFERRHIRSVVEKHTVQGLWTFIHYSERVLRLFEQGKLGKADSPFSVGSPVRIFRKLIEKERQLLPHLRKLIPKDTYREAEEVLRRCENLSMHLETAQKNSSSSQ